MHGEPGILLIYRSDQRIKTGGGQAVAHLPAVYPCGRRTAGGYADRLKAGLVRVVRFVGAGEGRGADSQCADGKDQFHNSHTSGDQDSVARTHTVTYGNARPPAWAKAGWVASNSRTWSSVLVRTWVGEVMQ